MFSFSFTGCLANKYDEPPVFAHSADLLFCSTVVLTNCIVFTGINLSGNGYDKHTSHL
jgi:hypothetical protein